MPPASRGAWMSLFRVSARSSCRCRRITTAPPERPGPATVRAPRQPPTRSVKEEAPAAGDPLTPPRTIAERSRARWEKRTPRFLKKRPYLRSFLYASFIAVPIATFGFIHSPLEIRTVTGPSMQPTINADTESDSDNRRNTTRVLVRRWGTNSGRAFNKKVRDNRNATSLSSGYGRGDLVLYQTPHDPTKIAIKRVVAVAGDTVQPLDGYPGGPEAVVVPYAHVWVEGDVNDRKKSVDSNYFGPISTALIRGTAIAMWSPVWNVWGFRRFHPGQSDWPAKSQRRVKEDAVHDASADPDSIVQWDMFLGSRGERVLKAFQDQSLLMEESFGADEQYRQRMHMIWKRGHAVARSYPDAAIKQRARDIVLHMERLFGRNALKEAGGREVKPGRQPGVKESEQTLEAEIARHFESAVAHQDERSVERQLAQTPAKAALAEMLKQKQLYGEMIDREHEERDKAREARGL